ncbi:hypothetical protein CGLAR1_12595 [Corynebacterium glutamicum]|nr:hypothetical protein CGLAR1_12595 [Corynebacterium glutamicum]AIK88823.1 hypothetical protein AR0_12730 [Corynebacterium glutamicum]
MKMPLFGAKWAESGQIINATNQNLRPFLWCRKKGIATQGRLCHIPKNTPKTPTKSLYKLHKLHTQDRLPRNTRLWQTLSAIAIREIFDLVGGVSPWVYK